MDVDPEDYHRYYRTLQRRRRRDAGPYRQYCVSAAGLDVPALWQGDDRRGHPLIGVSGYRLTETSRANSYTSEVSWLINVIYLTQAHQRLCALRVVRTLVGYALIIPNVANYRNYIGLRFAFVQFIYGMSKSVTTVGECGASSITLD